MEGRTGAQFEHLVGGIHQIGDGQERRPASWTLTAGLVKVAQPEAPSASGEIRADGSVRPAGPGGSSPHGALPGSAHFSSAALLSVRYTGTTERLPSMEGWYRASGSTSERRAD